MLEHVGAVLEDLAGRRVEGDEDVGAGLVAGRLDPGEDRLQRRLVGVEVRREAALVADGGREPLRGEALLQRVEDLGAHPQALREARRAGRHDHELLEVDRVVGVGAAVEHVHHRHRQQRRLAAAVELGQVAVERLAGVGRGGLGRGQRDAEDRVGAQPALVGRAVELDHRLVEGALLGGACARQRRGDLAVDVGDRARDALAGPGVAAVAQLDRLELAGRGARGHRREAARAGLERHLDLDRRVAARVEDLAGVDGGDGAHGARQSIDGRAGRARLLERFGRARRRAPEARSAPPRRPGIFFAPRSLEPGRVRALGQRLAFRCEAGDRARQRRFQLETGAGQASGGVFRVAS